MNRRHWLTAALFMAFSFLVGFSYDYHLPKLESFLLVEIETLSQTHSPIRIWAQRLHFHVLPLGVVLEDVRLLPQSPLDVYVAPTRVSEVGLRLAIWPLLRGEVRLAQVHLHTAEINVFLKDSLWAKEARPHNPAKINFEELYRLPIDEIRLDDIQIQGRVSPKDLVFRVSDLDLLLENRYQSIFVELNSPRILVKPSGPFSPLNAQLELRTLIEAQEIQVSAIKLKANDSFVVASGRFNGDFTRGQIESAAFDARTKVQLPNLNDWEQGLSAEPRLPRLQGRAEIDINFELKPKQKPRVESEIATHDVVIDKFTVGAIQGHISGDEKAVSGSLIRAENSAGKASLKNLQISFDPEPTFSSEVVVEDLEVHQLLENLSVKHVPIVVPVRAEALCQGVWRPHPELTCQGNATAKSVHVDSGRPRFSTIVEIGEARVNGQVKVTAQEVEYKADAHTANSKGSSTGIINYDTGFKINYQGDHVELKDIKNLVDLKVEGIINKISGTTVGTSKWATLDLQADGKDLWLENYPLGQTSTHLTYKTDQLKFANVVGQMGVSRYNGEVNVDLERKRIRINGQVPFMDLKDVQGLFQRRVQFPFAASGTGTGHLTAEGPFRFQDLTYDFVSSFYRGQIANESFDTANFQVKAVDGMVRSQRIDLSKGSGVIEVKGQITPSGEIDTVAVGRGLRLEQSENISRLGFDLQGLADFTVLVRGQLPHPHVDLNTRLSKVTLGDQPAEDSVFKLSFLNDRVNGDGQFLGSTLVTKFEIPYNNDNRFYLSLKSKKWDYTNLFSLVSRTAHQLDFSTAITGDIQLQAAHGGFWNSTGQAKISEFTIRRGTKTLSNAQPMVLNFHEGVVNSQNCQINSGDSYLKLDVAALSREQLNASLNGKMDVSFLGLFTPFMSDLRGNMAITMDLKGRADQPLLSGSAFFDHGYAKLNDFPHAFTNAKADVLFNNNEVLINSLRSDLAGGHIAGDGKITFNPKNRPVQVKGTFTDVKVHIPEGFKTEGSGRVSIHGDNFPYMMDITYDVTGGLIAYEFGSSTDSGTATVKASPFLPHFTEQESFQAFTYNIDGKTINPLPISTSLVQGAINGHLRASGTPDRMQLTGSLTAQPGGKLFFKNVPFDVNTAYIEYQNAAPNAPKVNILASTIAIENVVDDQGHATQNQYDVTMSVQGQGPTPQIILNSTPPLGQREIVSLLALGTTGANSSAEDRRGTAESQQANSSAILGGAVLQRAGGAAVKEALGVDVKVTSTQPNLVDTAALPKVTLSKQWTPKFGASASSTIEASPNNNVKLEYKMDKNISVIGSWDGRETLHDQQQDTTRNVLGLDLEYKLQFK